MNPQDKNKTGKPALQIVAEHWGDSAPEWVVMLAKNCETYSQRAVGNKINYSTAVINYVLKNRYRGDMKSVRLRVEKAFSGGVHCPVYGPIDGEECMANQQKPYYPGNHMAVALFVACRRCPNNVSCQEKKK